MGNIPHNFTNYWIGKFPRLLSHSYHALERCSHEPSFQHYYAHDGGFSKPEYFYVADELPTGALDWRLSQGTGVGLASSAGDASAVLNWRNSIPTQGSPQKKSKKGAYNFRRAGEEGTAINGGVGLGGGAGDGPKRKKYYPRKI